MKKVYIDANIIIDLFDKTRVYKENEKMYNLHEKAIELFVKLESSDVLIVISEDIISNVAYYFRKNKENTKKFMLFLQDIYDSKNYIFSSFGSKVIKKAIDSYFKQKLLDFEDSLQYYCALENECEIIYTNDKNFPKLDIRVESTIQ